MGRLTAVCSGLVPPLFRVAGTAESLVPPGLFRRSGQIWHNAYTRARLARTFAPTPQIIVHAYTWIYRRNSGTALYSCGSRLFRVAVTSPEQIKRPEQIKTEALNG